MKMRQKSSEIIEGSNNSLGFAVGILTAIASSAAARLVLRPFVLERGWQHPDVIWNPLAHIPVTTDTTFLVALTGFLGNVLAGGGDIFRQMSRKTAKMVGGVALASGLAVNTAIEVPAIAHAVGIDHIFHYHSDRMDELFWGYEASIITSGALTLSMCPREKEAESLPAV